MNKGTVTTASLSDLRNMDLTPYNVKLFIVRKPGKVMDSLSKMGFVHVPELSPSPELFERTKKMKLENPDGWFKAFEEGLLAQADTMVKYLDRIEEHIENGRNVLLVCYCKNESTCHRKSIKTIIEIRQILKRKEEKE